MSTKVKDYTEKDILEAIYNSSGIVSNIAESLKCSWGTAKIYIDKYPSCIEALNDENESILDLAENKMLELIEEKDDKMIRYLLSTKGKKRGYTEKTEVGITVNEDNEFKIVKKIDADS